MKMEKLNKLIKECKCGIHLTINSHRDYHETVEQFFKSNKNPFDDEVFDDIDSDIYAKMKETDTIISLHFYPNNPIGSYQIYHYDLETAIDRALYIINIK